MYPMRLVRAANGFLGKYQLLLWQCEIHRCADIIKFSRAVYTAVIGQYIGYIKVHSSHNQKKKQHHKKENQVYL